MLDINKYTVYCEGRGYLDKKRYAEDMANAKFNQRVGQDQQDSLISQAFRNAQTRLPTQPQNNPPQPFFALPTFIQRGTEFLLKPLQNAAEFLRNLFQQQRPQTQAQNPNQAMTRGPLFERVMSQVLSLFFGPKNDKAKEKKDLEERDQVDFVLRDIFGQPVVEASNGSNMGGGQ